MLVLPGHLTAGIPLAAAQISSVVKTEVYMI